MYQVLFGLKFTVFSQAVATWATENDIKVVISNPLGVLVCLFETIEAFELFCEELKKVTEDVVGDNIPLMAQFDSGLYHIEGKPHLIRGLYTKRMNQVLALLPRIAATPRSMITPRNSVPTS